MKLYKNGNVFVNGNVVRTDIAVERGRIIEMSPDIVADELTEVIDVTDKYLLPALVDVCCKGDDKCAFDNATYEQMQLICNYHIQHGVGTLFATLTTADETKVACVERLCHEYPEVKGIHLYNCVSDGNTLEKLQSCANGLIRLVTLNADCDSAVDVFKTAVRLGIKVLVFGNAENVTQFVNNGAKGVIDLDTKIDLSLPTSWAKALTSDVFTCVRLDGSIANDTLKLVTRVKSACIVGITGNTNAYKALANTVTFCELPLADAIKLWTEYPAKLVGLFDRVGSIEINKDADFIIFGK